MTKNMISAASVVIAAAACSDPPAPHTPSNDTSSAVGSTSGSSTTSSTTPVNAGATSSDKPAAPMLTETPTSTLGTAPAGFGLKVGEKAPDATLVDVTGQSQSLAQLFAQGPTVLLFYRGGWCPFCNLQLHEYKNAKGEFEKRGVQIVAISVDQPSEEAKTQAKNGVPFTMLSDSKLVAHQAYHVVHVPGEGERKALAGYGVDLASYSGESHGRFAVAATFVVDRGSVVRFAHVDEDFKTRPSAKQMLGVVDRLLAH